MRGDDNDAVGVIPSPFFASASGPPTNDSGETCRMQGSKPGPCASLPANMHMAFANEGKIKESACLVARIGHNFCDLPLPLIQVGLGKRALAKILVVDDDPAVQMTIRLLLERAGHSVVVAGDGKKGIAAFETGNFDLLFLDIFMPGMDGLEAMRHIHRRQPAMPIIVISGRPLVTDAGAEPNYLAMAIKLGAISSLPKPFRPAELLAKVESCLRARDRNAASGR
jgi:CheY-like chemotaxis protein